jgi:hypothetical protein
MDPWGELGGRGRKCWGQRKEAAKKKRHPPLLSDGNLLRRWKSEWGVDAVDLLDDSRKSSGDAKEAVKINIQPSSFHQFGLLE